MTIDNEAGRAKAPLLRVADIETFYGPVRALEGVSIAVGKGEIAALLGANGAGKTTLLKTISGVVRPARGSVECFGRSLIGMDADRIVQLGVGHVPEGREVFPFLTVRENMLVGAHLRRDKDEIRRDFEVYCEYFPILKERADVAAGLLSGGQQQMLAIARAMMSRPTVLLMDEPSLGLSPLFTKKIFEIIRRINDELGVTIVLVEQNVKMALDAAHYAYVLTNGEITLAGPAKELASRDDLKKFYLGGRTPEVSP
jgi:branched-chain amino acid transport system ATP-binding protein